MKTICDWENCKQEGSYRAPIEKDNSKKYRLLCLDHIKTFNKSGIIFQICLIKKLNFLLNLI